MTLLLLLTGEGTPPGPSNYSWRVRATDEHGVVGSWSDPDEFEVEQIGSAPICTLIPAASQVAPLVTHWSYYDADGDLQTDYQVQLANDDEFTDIEEDSGAVESTELHYLHTTESAGTYYRRVRVRTDYADWSDWVDDQVTLTAPTVQTTDVAVYLSADTTPVALNQTAYPVSGVMVTNRACAAAECTFTINNFDGLEGGIAEDDEILVYLMDSDGNRVEFRGAVVDEDVGDLLTVTCQDIGRLFETWRCNLSLSYLGIGEVVAAMVTAPNANTATGIVAHCEEIMDADGNVVRVKNFHGAGKTVAAWLSELSEMTGYRWFIRTVDNVAHFYWYNPAAAPTSTITLRDDIDRADNSATQWRVKDGVAVKRTRRNYRNRVEYTGVPDPPEPPGGMSNYDEYFTESDTDWLPFDDERCTVETCTDASWVMFYTTEAPNRAGYQRGAGSIKITYTFPEGTGEASTWPTVTPLVYRYLPIGWQNWYQASFGSLTTQAIMSMSPTKDSYVYWYHFPPDTMEIANDKQGVYLAPILYLFTSAAGITNVQNVTAMPGAVDAGSYYQFPAPRWQEFTDWHTYTYNNLPYYWPIIPYPQEVWSHVVALGFGLALGSTHGMGIDGWIPEYRLLLDDMHPDIPERLLNPSPVSAYVETAAVTAGDEVPIPMAIDTTGMNISAARSLATLQLGQVAKTQESVGALAVDGIRPVALNLLQPLVLPSRGIASETKAVYEVVWKPLDSGDETVITVGDAPIDVRKALVAVRDKLDALFGGLL